MCINYILTMQNYRHIILCTTSRHATKHCMPVATASYILCVLFVIDISQQNELNTESDV